MANINVQLDCRNNQYPILDGYSTTNSSIGTEYSYKYSGGTDGSGGVDEPTGSGTQTITVSVGGDARYTISSISFSGSDTSDLSWAAGPTANTAIITDTTASDMDDEYSVTVNDSVANCTFVCDPPIRNKPPA